MVLCHPEEASLNHAVADLALHALQARGHGVYFHDLVKERFNPLLTAVEIRRRLSLDVQVQRFSRELAAAGGMVFIHPEWWNGPPAQLKGWIDRVLRPGVAYEYAGEEFSRKTKVPLLSGKRALVLATTDAEPEEAGEPLLSRLWRTTLEFCGVSDFTFEMASGVRDLPFAERKEWLLRVERLVAGLFPAGA